MQLKKYLLLNITIFCIAILSNTTNAQISSDPTTFAVQHSFTGNPINDYTNGISANTEHLENVQFKYGIRLNVPVETIANLALYYVIDYWYGTRYRMGGTSKNGIDCSAFMQVLMNTVYNTAIPRTAHEQYNAAMKVSAGDWQEGDLVFFSRKGHAVGHVGMYLGNNKFVQASSSKGVMISDLGETYWVKHFVGVGRIQHLLVQH